LIDADILTCGRSGVVLIDRDNVDARAERLPSQISG
jgi:hypothetical protein